MQSTLVFLHGYWYYFESDAVLLEEQIAFWDKTEIHNIGFWRFDKQNFWSHLNDVKQKSHPAANGEIWSMQIDKKI